MMKTEAVKRFLAAYAQPDLAELYTSSMECQVNVRQLDGERVEGTFMGKNWQGYSNGIETWKPYRIPFNAYKDANYTDSPIRWNFERYVEAIGMTGWDWENRVSRWIAYDFDALVGHSDKHLAKLTAEELMEVQEAACALDYVSVRRSSSGNGLHLYVFVAPTETDNHHEHAALGRAILAKMSLDAGYDFKSSVDVCGGNMWVWSRKAEQNPDLAFKLIKEGGILTDIPLHWRDHIKVSKGQRRKSLPKAVESVEDDFDLLCGRTVKSELDKTHRQLLDWLRDNNAVWWWDNDNKMLVTHTWWLMQAHNSLNYAGAFFTDSKGENKHEQNCFCFPMKQGAWSVRRFTPGCGEHNSWEQDSAGWTRTYLNREPDLQTAARVKGAVEDIKGNFNFDEAEVAVSTMRMLGVNVEIDPRLGANPSQIKRHKDGRIVMSVEIGSTKSSILEMPGWHLEKEKTYTRIFNAKAATSEEAKGTLYDDSIRFLIEPTGGYSEIGWFTFLEEEKVWVSLSANSLTKMLKHHGLKSTEVDEAMGASIARPWKNVVEPFQPEYPGERSWNRNGARLKYQPIEADEYICPNWDKVLEHLGAQITDAVKANKWCRDNGLLTGADYLRVWCASLFQKPKQPLPYLFFYSASNNTGKSTLGEALSRLMTRGSIKASSCLNPQNTFNGELDGAVLCLVEETELDASPKVYARLKDWVTSPDLGIHPKGGTPYVTVNTTHWIHTANNHNACKVLSGDTRFVVISVNDLKEEIPKEVLLHQLMQEAPHFLGQLFAIELPEPDGRLAIPCLETYQKNAIISNNLSPVEMFFNVCCEEKLGYATKANVLLAAFHEWLGDPEEAQKYGSKKFYAVLPPEYQKGYVSFEGGNYVPNLVISEEAGLTIPDKATRCIQEGVRLVINHRQMIVPIE